MIQPGCRQEDHPRISRRELLRAGGLGLFAVGLADLLRLEARAVPRRPRGSRDRWSSSSSREVRRSTRPSTPSPMRPT